MPGIISPTRHVLADPQTLFHQRLPQRIGHAVELLEFDGRRRQSLFLQEGKRVGDRADVVRSQGQLDAALARPPRHGLDEHRRHALETGIGGPLVGPDRDGPAHPLGVDHFVVPVGALDQPHAHLPAATRKRVPPGPVDQPGGVVRAAAEVGLHGQAGGELDGLAAALEEGDRQVFDGRLLHVEVDHHPLLGRLAEDRRQGVRQGPQASPRSRWRRSAGSAR